MKRVALTVALGALAVPAMAEDPRLVERVYDPSQVIRIEGKTSVQTTIGFGEDEMIENVAIGDSQAWQVTPNKRANLLFVKPLAERAATNMTVITNRYTYLFDLVANPRAEAPLYVVSFRYPDELEAAGRAAGEDAPAANVESSAAIEPVPASEPYTMLDPPGLSYAWTIRGARKIAPVTVYDNGDATFLTWAPGTPVPAILMKNEAGVEGPVNFAVRGDVIVIEGVPREIVLRLGKDSATLINNGPVRQPRSNTGAQGAAPDIVEVKR